MLKKKLFVIGTGISSFGLAVPALASESTGTANSAVVSAMTTVANDMSATATSLIPVALTVVGISLVVVFGIRIFKRIAK